MIPTRRLSQTLLLAAAAVVVMAWGGAREARAWTTIYNCNNAWPSSSMPVGYRVTDSVTSLGAAASSLEEIRSIYRASFETWSAPCCSSFAASDQGTTTASGENTSDNINAITILTDRWPRALGPSQSTLGVTVTAADGQCNIVGSDVVFNAFTWTYSDGGGGGTTDFQSIAVHEFGHFLGLGHSNLPEATMYPAYTGPGGRSLDSDDQDGVCTLYEQACNCSSNAECNGRQECIDSVCQIPPCESNLDCEAGLECTASGDCVVPPCGSDADCVSGNVCDNGSCVADADCPVCGECSTNADCGTNGVCIPAGYISETSACTKWCQSSADCPGNTDCFLVPTQEGDVPLCFNDDADTQGACPGGFVCQGDDGPFNPCDGVVCGGGQTCNPLTGLCEGGGGGVSCRVCESCFAGADECGTGGTCLEFVDGPTVCSVACGADGSCPGNSSCFQLSDGNGGVENWCLNDDAAAAGVCSGGWSCVDTTNLCEGVSCGSGQACNPATGLCESDTDNPDNPDNPPDGGTGTGQDGSGGDGGGCLSVAGGSRSAGDALWLVLALLGLLLGRRRGR